MNEDVDRIREINEAVGRGDLETVSAYMHRDAVWEHNIGLSTPEEGVYEGRESILRLFERILEPWEYMRPEPREITLSDDGTYVVTGELRSKHRTSEAEVRTSYEQRMEIREGLLVRGRMTTGQMA